MPGGGDEDRDEHQEFEVKPHGRLGASGQ